MKGVKIERRWKRLKKNSRVTEELQNGGRRVRSLSVFDALPVTWRHTYWVCKDQMHIFKLNSSTIA